MPVDFITPLTASCSLPPSVVNSFWNSMHTSAVFDAATSQPPFASSGAYAENGFSFTTSTLFVPPQRTICNARASAVQTQI